MIIKYIKILRTLSDPFLRFMPRSVLHWFGIIVWWVVLTVVIVILVTFVFENLGADKQDVRENYKGASVPDRKLLREVLDDYEKKRKKFNSLKHSAPSTVDPSL